MLAPPVQAQDRGRVTALVKGGALQGGRLDRPVAGPHVVAGIFQVPEPLDPDPPFGGEPRQEALDIHHRPALELAKGLAIPRQPGNGPAELVPAQSGNGLAAQGRDGHRSALLGGGQYRLE